MEITVRYVEFLEALLTSIFECGLRDLSELFEKTMVLKEVSKEYISIWRLTDEIVEYARENLQSLDYGSIAYTIASMIYYELEEAIEESDLKEKLMKDFDELVIDYGIISSEILDVLKPEMSRDEMIKIAREKLKNLES